MLGMASSRDPLEGLFSHWLLQMIGNWSYSQFIFQFVVFYLYQYITGSSVVESSLQFWLFLTAVASLGYNYIQFQMKDAKRFKLFLQCCLPLCIV